MQARCPHCSNVFNTERAGVQFCPNCGQQINVPDPSAASGGPPPGAGMPPPPPPPGGPGASAGRGLLPWEERGQRGLFGAFWENWKMVITRPEEFWRRMRPDGSLGDGLFFGWICYAITGILSLPFNFLVQGINRQQMEELFRTMKDLPPEARQPMEQLVGLFTGPGSVGMAIGNLIIFPVVLIISALFTHLFGLIFGVAKNGFNGTVRVVGYSYAPYLYAWVPVCGALVAVIHYLVLLVWGMARVHESSVTRAVLAVIVLPILLLCCCAGVIGLGVAGLVGAAGGR